MRKTRLKVFGARAFVDDVCGDSLVQPVFMKVILPAIISPDLLSHIRKKYSVRQF